MARANDVIAAPDLVQVRAILEASLTKLVDAQDYLAGQIAVLDGIERQVRVLALREATRAVDANADADELRDLGALQAETNANFRQMRETYARLSAQIAVLKAQQETLCAATGARAAGGMP